MWTVSWLVINSSVRGYHEYQNIWQPENENVQGKWIIHMTLKLLAWLSEGRVLATCPTTYPEFVQCL